MFDDIDKFCGSAVGLIFIFLLISSSAFVWESIPPGNYSLHKVRVNGFNNSSDMNSDIASNNFGVSNLFGLVGIVSLFISVLGFIITLLIMALGNYRQQFYTTLISLKDLDVKIPLTLLNGTIEESHKDMNEAAIKISTHVRYFMLITIVFLLVIFFILVVFQLSFIEHVWGWIWGVLLLYFFSLIIFLYNILNLSRKGMSYPKLAEIHKHLGDYLIDHLRKAHLGNAYLFCWDCWSEISGNDDARLIKFVADATSEIWIDAKIEKIDSKNIKVYTQRKSILLTLNDENSEAILRYKEEEVERVIARMENGKLNMYRKHKED